MEADIRHQRGVAVIWKEAAGWQVEVTVKFGLNVVSLLLMLGARQY